MTLVLASASPRRRDLLERLGVQFRVMPVDIDEDAGTTTDPQILARRLARTKAEAARLRDPHSAVIAADTVVAHDGRILGKPRDATDARAMLRALRGAEHRVVTAVAVLSEGERAVLARQPITTVRMRDYSDAEIDAYIASGDPFDKAGSYGIQDVDFAPVESYDGCYCNVIGLPLWATVTLLRRAGVGVAVGSARLLPQCASCPDREG